VDRRRRAGFRRPDATETDDYKQVIKNASAGGRRGATPGGRGFSFPGNERLENIFPTPENFGGGKQGGQFLPRMTRMARMRVFLAIRVTG